jgi:hypothetical protein
LRRTLWRDAQHRPIVVDDRAVRRALGVADRAIDGVLENDLEGFVSLP